MALAFNFTYQIELWQYALGFVLLVVFSAVAWKGLKISLGTRLYSPLMIWFLGAAFVMVRFIVIYGLSARHVVGCVILGVLLLLYAGFFVIYSGMNWKKATMKHYYVATVDFSTGLIVYPFFSVRIHPEDIGNLMAEIIFIMIVAVVYWKLVRKNR